MPLLYKSKLAFTAPIPSLPVIVELLPLNVIGPSVKVSEGAPEVPSHLVTDCPVPAPHITDVLSIFCHRSVPTPGVTSENIHQSPTFQESGSVVAPFGVALPAVLTI